ncbi:MAG: septum formation protein Maf [Lentisphaeria bacterium]|nr:septum formation protein Maf [Lentisphaeria bacterium]
MKELPFPVILASASPRRSDLLGGLGVPFQIHTADVDEISQSAGDAFYIARTNAALKARKIADQYPASLVIGADTVVELSGTIFGKPENQADAVRMLSMLSGKQHRVITGVALIFQQYNIEKIFAVITEVTFKKLTPEQIILYMDQVNVMDKAGAYGIQEHGEILLDKMEGSLSNVIGLPVEKLEEELLTLAAGVRAVSAQK